MSDTRQQKNSENFWNIIFTLLYIGTFVVGMMLLMKVNGELPKSIPLFDLILIALAAFRLTRLFVYDHITQFFRDLFLDTEEYVDERGAVVVRRLPPIKGPRRTINTLLGCPWCFGMWAGLLVPLFYFLTPYAWFVILALAVSGLGTALMLVFNWIGWSAEYRKKKAQAKFGEQHIT